MAAAADYTEEFWTVSYSGPDTTAGEDLIMSATAVFAQSDIPKFEAAGWDMEKRIRLQPCDGFFWYVRYSLRPLDGFDAEERRMLEDVPEDYADAALSSAEIMTLAACGHFILIVDGPFESRAKADEMLRFFTRPENGH